MEANGYVELFEDLKSRLSEPQLVELTSAIAWENYRARFDHAFGIGSEGFSEGAYCPLPEGKGAGGEHAQAVVASTNA